MVHVSQTQRSKGERSHIAALSPVERAWLEERIREYRDLLDYLRDH